MTSITPPPSSAGRRVATYASARLRVKKIAASTAVVRDRKFAEPVAPNRLPEAPPPKPEPMSAPLPCWSSTRPMIASATSTCRTISTLVQPIMSSSFRRRLNDGEKFLRDPRPRADPAAVDVRHGEQSRCVAGLHAPAIDNPGFCRKPFPEKRVHGLRLMRRCRPAGADRPHRLVSQYRIRKSAFAQNPVKLPPHHSPPPP